MAGHFKGNCRGSARIAAAGTCVARRLLNYAPVPMPVDVNEFVIVGLTRDGKPFRPSDWAERLCGVMAQFGADNRMQYSPYVYPIVLEGTKCVVVDARLKEIEPLALRFLENFA